MARVHSIYLWFSSRRPRVPAYTCWLIQRVYEKSTPIRPAHRLRDRRGEIETTERIAQVYRHSDGYPESVLLDLSLLNDLLMRTRTVRGPEYAAAQFIFLRKLGVMAMYLGRDPERSIRASKPADFLQPTSFDHIDQPMFLLGHGVENPADGIHGDEEYLYVVEIPWHDPGTNLGSGR